MRKIVRDPLTSGSSTILSPLISPINRKKSFKSASFSSNEISSPLYLGACAAGTAVITWLAGDLNWQSRRRHCGRRLRQSDGYGSRSGRQAEDFAEQAQLTATVQETQALSPLPIAVGFAGGAAETMGASAQQLELRSPRPPLAAQELQTRPVGVSFGLSGSKPGRRTASSAGGSGSIH